uniref:LAGLIDADG endonuclease n=1 Tax=Apiotrichum gamsii TaxID=1105092 RepID=A0A8K1ZR63_9TREE|nr:LAGLIDADG endonuclease [Apiotrichum gamsii]
MENIFINSVVLTSSPRYLIKFWVGLLEGDGTITVDKSHKKLKNIRVRIVISMKHTLDNFNMLKSIQTVIGGRVIIERKNQYVTWIASSKTDVKHCLYVLTKYPLITLRKQLQLKFAINCINDSSFYTIENRNNKYNIPFEYILPLNINTYFPIWLSGFTEAEGHFKVLLYDTGKIRNLSLTIGQNNGLILLEMIKEYFKSHHKITIDKSTKNKIPDLQYYRISISGPKSNLEILNHFTNYPLLGEKLNQFKKWERQVKKLLNL